MNTETRKPWIARAWAGKKLLIEARYADAGEAQDALTRYAQGGTGFTRVSIDYEGEENNHENRASTVRSAR